MRSLVIALAVLGTTSAYACPLPKLCGPLPHMGAADSAATTAKNAPAQLAMRFVTRAPTFANTTSVSFPTIARQRPVATDEPQIPWFWEALRSRVHERMPQMHDREHQINVMMSPVVVSGTDDTVPGLGIAGDF